MQLVYYKHYLEYQGHRYIYDFKTLLRDYIDKAPDELKMEMKTCDGHHLYLFETDNKSIFLFAMVKDDELVKAINTSKLSQEDIHNKLSDNEKLGFASYIYAGDVFYGIATTFFGPKNGVWQRFINDLLYRKTNNNCIQLQSEAFPTKITREELIDLKFASTTKIRINDKHPIFAMIKRLFGYSDDAKSIEFVVTPSRNKFLYDSKNQIQNLISNFSDDVGLEKFIVSGKNALNDILTEYYLVGSGHIRDSIPDRGETAICQKIQEKVLSNSMLKTEIEKMRNDRNYQQNLVQDISVPLSTDTWNTNLL